MSKIWFTPGNRAPSRPVERERPGAGRPNLLDVDQRGIVTAWLELEPSENGVAGWDRWNGPMLVRKIKKEFDVTIGVRHAQRFIKCVNNGGAL